MQNLYSQPKPRFFGAVSESKLSPEQFEKYKKADAVGLKQNGLLIFIASTPVEKYKILGDIQMNAIDSRKFGDQILTLTNKAKKQYPNAHGIIIDTSDDRFKAAVIVFDDLK